MLEVVAGQRIGYATDLRYTFANEDVLAQLMPDVDHLFIESVFLDADREQALRDEMREAWRAACEA